MKEIDLWRARFTGKMGNLGLQTFGEYDVRGHRALIEGMTKDASAIKGWKDSL
jgi:hypothetical protein